MSDNSKNNDTVGGIDPNDFGPDFSEFGAEAMPVSSSTAKRPFATKMSPENEFDDLRAFGDDPNPDPDVDLIPDDDDGFDSEPQQPSRRQAMKSDVDIDGLPINDRHDMQNEDEFSANEEDGDESEEEEEEHLESYQPDNKKKLLTYAIGALAAAGISYYGYTFVTPLISDMMGWNTAPRPSTNFQTTSVPTNTPTNAPAQAPIGVKVLQPESSPPAKLPTLPPISSPNEPSTQQPVVQPTRESPSQQQVPTQVIRTPIELKAPVDLPIAQTTPLPPKNIPPSASKEDLESLKSDLSAQMAKISNDINRINDRIATLESAKVVPAPRPTVIVPNKPEILRNYILKAVSRDTAWVENVATGQTVEVKAGSEIDGAGTVQSVKRYENEWMVTTTTGLILRKR